MKRVRMLARLVLLACVCLLSACLVESDKQQVRTVTIQFWEAILQGDQQAAKALVTLESSDYLPMLQAERLSLQSFELGDLRVEKQQAQVIMRLRGGEKGDLNIPMRTVLRREGELWRIDVKYTTAYLVSGSLDATVNQLDALMQKDLPGLKQLSEEEESAEMTAAERQSHTNTE